MAEATRAHSQMEALHRKLRPLPAERRRLLLGHLDSTALYCKLVTIPRVCKELFLTSPKEALDLPSFGLELLAENREVLEPEASVSFEASVLAHYGNGLRIIGVLREAEKCLRKAEKLSSAAGDPLDQAWACRYLGYVLADSRKYEEALRFARAAKRTFKEVHEEKLLLETQAVEAKFLWNAGRNEESVQLLKALEAPVRAGSHVTLELSVKERLALNYIHGNSLSRPTAHA